MPPFFSRKSHKPSKYEPPPAAPQGASAMQQPAPAKTSPEPPPVTNPPLRGASVRDLWKEAFESLTQTERDALQPPGNSSDQDVVILKYAMIESIIELTKTEYENYCQRGWHVKKGDTSKEANVRLLAKELLISALDFKDVIDAGLEFDPTGYGTIIWGPSRAV